MRGSVTCTLVEEISYLGVKAQTYQGFNLIPHPSQWVFIVKHGWSSVETKGLVTTSLHAVVHAMTDLLCWSTGKTQNWNFMRERGKQKKKKVGEKPVNGLKNVHVGSIQAGRKNEYAECLGCLITQKKNNPNFSVDCKHFDWMTTSNITTVIYCSNLKPERLLSGKNKNISMFLMWLRKKIRWRKDYEIFLSWRGHN